MVKLHHYVGALLRRVRRWAPSPLRHDRDLPWEIVVQEVDVCGSAVELQRRDAAGTAWVPSKVPAFELALRCLPIQSCQA